MSDFPKLKTGAVLQYPGTREVRFDTEILRFVDGREQRFPKAPHPLHRWQIRLTALDEDEMAAIERFFESQEGEFGDFRFTDPWDGVEYPSCSLENGSVNLEASAEMQGRTSLGIRENRA